MAGLPQGGETPLGREFVKHWLFVNICTHFQFLANIYRLFYVTSLPFILKTTTGMNRAPVVEKCCDSKIIENLLSNCPSLPAEVRETERTKLNFVHFWLRHLAKH